MITVGFIESVSEQLMAFVIVMTRLSATFTTLTIFRRDMMPTRVVIVLSVVLSLFVLMSGQIDALHFQLPASQLFSSLVLQICLGFIMGFIINLFIELFLALGQLISTQSGLGFVNLFIPKVGTVTPLSQFFIIFASVIFFELNGHLILIKMSIESFQIHLKGLSSIKREDLNSILLFSKVIFSGSFMLSLSVIISLLISNITIAVMTKFAQQLNIFSIGINISLIICFFVIYISFDAILDNGTILLNDCLRFAEKTDMSIIHHE